jgi:hypothetical protein
MVFVADNAADTRRAIARRDIEILPRSVRPDVMDIGWQSDGGAPPQARVVDIDFVMSKLRSNARVKHYVCGHSATSLEGNWKHSGRQHKRRGGSIEASSTT